MRMIDEEIVAAAAASGADPVALKHLVRPLLALPDSHRGDPVAWAKELSVATQDRNSDVLRETVNRIVAKGNWCPAIPDIVEECDAINREIGGAEDFVLRDVSDVRAGYARMGCQVGPIARASAAAACRRDLQDDQWRKIIEFVRNSLTEDGWTDEPADLLGIKKKVSSSRTPACRSTRTDSAQFRAKFALNSPSLQRSKQQGSTRAACGTGAEGGFADAGGGALAGDGGGSSLKGRRSQVGQGTSSTRVSSQAKAVNVGCGQLHVPDHERDTLEDPPCPPPPRSAPRFAACTRAGCFVIPNPWDIGTTRYLQNLGFKALATTSAGFAWSRGLRRRWRSARHDARPYRRAVGRRRRADERGLRGRLRARARGRGRERAAVRGDRRVRALDRGLHRRQGQAAVRLRHGGGAHAAARAAIDKAGGDVLLTGRSEGFIRGRADMERDHPRG